MNIPALLAASAPLLLFVVTCQAQSNWQVVERPPALLDPRRVDLTTVEPIRIEGYGLHCPGFIRQVRFAADEDGLIYMSGHEALRYPVHVTGGRNVRMVGVQIEIETQPGCSVGELPNLPAEKHARANIHPRVPGGIAVRMEQTGVSFVEGASIDLLGHEADCFVSRNPARMTISTAKAQRDFVIQNTYCSGIEGLGASDIGDGVHGDFWQNQGSPPDTLRRLVFENVSVRTSQEGLVLLSSTQRAAGAAELVLRRFDYSWDRRYVGDDEYEMFGLAVDGYADEAVLEEVWIDDYRDGGDYLMINGQRFGAAARNNIVSHAGIRSGLPPPDRAFALPERTGLNYFSPHGGVEAR